MLLSIILIMFNNVQLPPSISTFAKLKLISEIGPKDN